MLALQPLYFSADLIPHLDLFTQKFKVRGRCLPAHSVCGFFPTDFSFLLQERLVSMKLDKEEAVSTAAIRLCTALLAQDMLEPEECVEICELVFFDSRLIARAAGEGPSFKETTPLQFRCQILPFARN